VVLVADDDAGEGLCSRLRFAGLPPGPVFVRVAASPLASLPTFGYRLSATLALGPCGDRVLQEGQECDDGNAVDGDGCSGGCRLEDRAELEPNDRPDQAGAPAAPPFAVAGVTGPPGDSGFDADWYAVELATPARLTVETFAVDSADCGALLAAPALHDAGGALVAESSLADVGPASCGRLTSPPLAPARYLILVETRPSPARYRLVVTEAAP
jgi:cysteine-rich repeat protein